MAFTEMVSGTGGCPTVTGQAGSLITALDFILVTTLGWTKTFSGTNKANYKAASGTQAVLYVDDTAAGSGGAREARVCGFKTDTALGTGTGQFPTAAQSTIGIGMEIIRKSNTADATARTLRAFGDGTTFYLCIETGDVTNPVAAYCFAFGDFVAAGPNDVSNAHIVGRTSENTANCNSGGSIIDPFAQLSLPVAGTSLQRTINGSYTMASGANVGGSLLYGKHTDYAKMGVDLGGDGWQIGYLGRWVGNNQNTTWFTNFACPNPFDLAEYMGEITIHQQGGVRGKWKNAYAPLQHMPFNHGDLIAGTGPFAGKNFRVITIAAVAHGGGANPGAVAQIFFQVP